MLWPCWRVEHLDSELPGCLDSTLSLGCARPQSWAGNCRSRRGEIRGSKLNLTVLRFICSEPTPDFLPMATDHTVARDSPNRRSNLEFSGSSWARDVPVVLRILPSRRNADGPDQQLNHKVFSPNEGPGSGNRMLQSSSFHAGSTAHRNRPDNQVHQGLSTPARHAATRALLCSILLFKKGRAQAYSISNPRRQLIFVDLSAPDWEQKHTKKNIPH